MLSVYAKYSIWNFLLGVIMLIVTFCGYAECHRAYCHTYGYSACHSADCHFYGDSACHCANCHIFVGMLSVIMLIVTFYCYAKCHYA